jgi:hypothetical protein
MRLVATVDDEPAPDAPRKVRSALVMVAVFVGLTLVLVRERSGEVGLWDWDTYGRLQFIHHYEPHIWVDGHLMYHGVMRVLMALGLRDLTAIEVETAAGVAALLCMLWWICRRERLSTAHTWLVLAAATIGSPGLVELYLMIEDNVLYLPVVLGVYYLLYMRHAGRRDAVRRGIIVGALIAIAMLINVSLLVMLFALAAAPLVWLRDRTRALGLVVAGATAVAAYYLSHVVLFPGAKIALHAFLPQALHLQDFAQSSTPIVSLARFEQYRGGLRAMGVAPSVHLMTLGPVLRVILLGVIPKLLVVLWGTLVVWLVRFRRAKLLTALRTRLDLLALIAIGLTFPYFYEPNLIERWDLFWVGCLFALVPLFKLAPSRFAVALVVSIIALQGVGTVVAVAHHYGLGWDTPGLAATRATAEVIKQRRGNLVVLPFELDRLLLADLKYRLRARTVYLVRDDGSTVSCVRLIDLVEHPVEIGELQTALAAPGNADSYVDPALSPRSRAALGLAP